jgi:monoterpene epsilon-lactone hydrolase
MPFYEKDNMINRSFPAPSSISEVARRFIDEAMPLESINTGLKALKAKRHELHSLYSPPGRDVQKTLGVIVEESEIDGVTVKWVKPQMIRHPQVILYFFGGGFITGSPDEDLAITARIAHFSGRKVCVPAYRLSPENPYPAALEDAVAVYQALLREYGAPSLALSGESAGGNLSLALIGAAASRGLPLPAAMALLSPWCDLTHSGDTIRTLDGIDPTIDLDHQLSHMARAYAGGRPLASPDISPLFADVAKGFPPTLISTGTRDVLLSDCARLSTKLRAAGVDVDLRVMEGMWHVFEFYPKLPEAEDSIRGIAAFLDKHLSLT